MKNNYKLFAAVAFIANSILASGNMDKHKPREKAQSQFSKNIRGNGLCFTPNKGQIVDMNRKPCPDVLFKSNGSNADIYLRSIGVSYVYSDLGKVMHEVNEQVEELISVGAFTEAEEKEKKDELLKRRVFTIHRLDMDFVNANTDISTFNTDEVEGYQNFYYAHCANGITNVKQYNKVTCKNIYNNIDINYYGSKESGLKYDIVVKPHADPNQIQLQWKGAESIYINSEGNLVIKTSVNEFTESIPKVYQNIDGKITDIKAQYRLDRLVNNDVVVHFSFSGFNSSYPLVIDPWLSYYGGSGPDMGSSATTDPSGNAVFTGVTASPNFPVSAGTFQTTYSGGTRNDVYIVKMAPNGTRLWATFYGGSDEDSFSEVATDAGGNIFIGGETFSKNFPIGALPGNVINQNTYNSVFLLKLTPAGTRIWATFYGDLLSGGSEPVGRVASDGTNVYLTSTARNFGLSTPGAFQVSLTGSYNAILAKFSSNGTHIWATYIGGGNDKPYGVACDLIGNVYVGGETFANFPVTAGAYHTSSGGNRDGFLCKLNPAGGFLWGTYYGGPGVDRVLDVATDKLGNVVITGETVSNTGIASAGAYQPGFGGGTGDAFVAKFNSSGNIQWSTYLGGSGAENYYSGSIATDKFNNVYAYGESEDSYDPNYPISPCAYQSVFGGDEDQFIAKYDPNGKQTCFTYIGGLGHDEIELTCPVTDIAIYDNCLYITGYTFGSYPVTPNAFQTNFAGGILPFGVHDAFMDQLCTNLCEAKVLGLDFTSATNTCINAPVVFTSTVVNSCDTLGYKFEWTFTGGSPLNSTAFNPTVTYPAPGIYPVKLLLTTFCGKDSIKKDSYITVNNCGCTLSAQASTVNNLSCTGANDGSVKATITSGGSGNYTYSWSNGSSSITTATTNQLNNVAAGTYTVTVTNGSCSFLSTTTITKALSINTITSTNATCNGGNNGSAAVSVSGAGGPYTYSWSNGANAITTSPTHQLNNLPAGTYTVTITDNACILTSTVIITAPPALAISASAQWTTCTSNGAKATVVAQNGTLPYTYLWNNGNTNPVVTGLTAGTYSVTVTDSKGCTTSQSMSAAQIPLQITSSGASSSNCNMYSQAGVYVSGFGPITYKWSNGMVGPTIVGVPPGNYIVTITDAAGCTLTKTFTIGGGTSVDASFTQSPNTTICAGTVVSFTNTGSLMNPIYNSLANQWTIYGSQGFNPPIATGSTNNYTYTFSSPGTYNVLHQIWTGINASLCKGWAVSTVTVINCAGPTVTATSSNICTGSCATVSAIGANGTNPYTYSWSTGATSQSINPCPANTTTYTITITDSKGITSSSTTTATVTVNPSVNVTVVSNNTSCNGAANGSATITPGSGTSPFIYIWSNNQSTQTATGLIQGNYTVAVTDSKSCTATSTITVLSPPALIGQFTKGSANCIGCGCKEWIVINATGGTSPYAYSWPDGYNNRYKNQLCPGNYTITIKDKNGCSVNVNLTAP